MKKKNIINKEKLNIDNNNNNNNNKIVINKEVFYEVNDQKGKIKSHDNESNNSQNLYNRIKDMTHDEDGVTIPMLLFGLSICIYIGIFIKSAIFS